MVSELKVIESCNMRKAETDYCPCILDGIMNTLGKKWTLSLIITIGNFGSLRFNGLLERMPNINPKTLSDRLKGLEKINLVERRQFNEMPVKVEYRLTKKGEDLYSSLLPLVRWSLKSHK